MFEIEISRLRSRKGWERRHFSWVRGRDIRGRRCAEVVRTLGVGGGVGQGGPGGRGGGGRGGISGYNTIRVCSGCDALGLDECFCVAVLVIWVSLLAIDKRLTVYLYTGTLR